ncbi:MAG: hypothetical protein IJB82_00425 [Bacilli bacterium]|nr:hypothetical protein [Bacilli bacterium]
MDKKRTVRSVGAAAQKAMDYNSRVKALETFCLRNGFSYDYFIKLKKQSDSHNHMSNDFIENLFDEYESNFERNGKSHEDFVAYMEKNISSLEIQKGTLENNFALYDYAGVLDEVIGNAYILSKNHNPGDLHAVIRYLRDTSNSTSPKLQLNQILNMLKKSSYAELKNLKERYPYSESKIGVVRTLHKIKSNRECEYSEFLETLLEKFRILFESYGFGPEELEKYVKENDIIYDINPRTLRYNFALYDSIGVLEEVLFDYPDILARNHNPEDLYAVIERMKELGIQKPLVQEIDYYLKALNKEELENLRNVFPYTTGKSGRNNSRHQALINSRLNANKAYSKTLSSNEE